MFFAPFILCLSLVSEVPPDGLPPAVETTAFCSVLEKAVTSGNVALIFDYLGSRSFTGDDYATMQRFLSNQPPEKAAEVKIKFRRIFQAITIQRPWLSEDLTTNLKQQFKRGLHSCSGAVQNLGHYGIIGGGPSGPGSD